MTLSHKQIIDNFLQIYSSDDRGEPIKSGTGLTMGVVVDTDDPLQMGRLRVFCPSLNDNPKKIHHLPWCSYVSPLAGSINNAEYARGHGVGPHSSTGSVHYGFWAVPEQGAHVLIGCVDGDPRRRFWLGCFSEHQETHTMHNGRWKWDGDDGTPDGPLTSDGSPIQPLYNNLGKAFNEERSSREWKTRAAEYQGSAIREDEGQIPNSKKANSLDEQYDKISEAEQDDWVKPILGSHGYDWTGHKNLGSFLSSRVYGFSSPGLHAFTMDDRPFNSRMRFRTTAGHQILLDDTNERIYISTYEGNNFIEMDTNGNIDVYSKRRVSIHAEKDINIFSDETVRIGGKKGVHLYAGYNEGQESLPSIPEDGQIRMHAEDDIHIITKKNLRQLSFEDTLIEVGGKQCVSIGTDLFLHVNNDINVVTNIGDFNVTITGDINELVNGNINRYALGTMKNMSNGNAQMHSFGGKIDMGAQATVNIKSIAEDITMEAVGKNPDRTAAIFMKAPESQYGVTSSGVFTATNKSIRSKSFEPIEYEQGVETQQDTPLPPQNVNTEECQAPLSIEGFTGINLAARVAYNAGFRGDALVVAVAIAGGESSYNPNAVGDVNLQTDKWGPSVGFWQIRTLTRPNEWSGVDAQRDINTIAGASNAQNNANVAFGVSSGGRNFKPWSVFTSGAYRQYMNAANAAVSSMCGGILTTMSHEDTFSAIFEFPDNFGESLINQCANSLLLVEDANAFIMNELGVQIQSTKDVIMKSVEESVNFQMFNDMYKTVNQLAAGQRLLTLNTGLAFKLQAALSGTPAGVIAGALLFLAQIDIEQIINYLKEQIPMVPTIPNLGNVDWMRVIGFDLSLGGMCNLDAPSFDSEIATMFDIEFNHAAFGTITKYFDPEYEGDTNGG